MPLRIFETKEARYYLGLAAHRVSSEKILRNVDLSSLDLLVLEDYLNPEKILSVHQYKELCNNIRRKNPNISIYGVNVDAHPMMIVDILVQSFMVLIGVSCIGRSGKGFIENVKSKSLTRRNFLKYSGIGATGLFFDSFLISPVSNAVTEDPIPGITDTYNLYTNIIPTYNVSFRDAIAAKKISEYLVPKHKHNNRKVQAAILYGTGHSGMEMKIKNPKIADATIAFYHKLLGLHTKDELNRIRVFVDNGKSSPYLHESCELF